MDYANSSSNFKMILQLSHWQRSLCHGPIHYHFRVKLSGSLSFPGPVFDITVLLTSLHNTQIGVVCYRIRVFSYTLAVVHNQSQQFWQRRNRSYLIQLMIKLDVDFLFLNNFWPKILACGVRYYYQVFKIDTFCSITAVKIYSYAVSKRQTMRTVFWVLHIFTWDARHTAWWSPTTRNLTPPS
jgi:hypothetical protein